MSEASVIVAALSSQAAVLAIVLGVLGVLGFLGRSIAKQWLDRNLRRFEDNLKAAANERMAAMTHGLEIAKLEHQIRFSNLHERRAGVIAEVYQLLVKVHAASAIFTSPVSWNGQPSKETQLRQARSDVHAFYVFFDQNKIWLPASVCDQIEKLVKDIHSAVETLGVYEPMIERESAPLHVRKDHAEQLKRASVQFSDEIPMAKELLEVELRRLLGDAP